MKIFEFSKIHRVNLHEKKRSFYLQDLTKFFYIIRGKVLLRLHRLSNLFLISNNTKYARSLMFFKIRLLKFVFIYT